MRDTSKSPLAPASEKRAEKSILRDEYTREDLFSPPPRHISYYLDKALKTLCFISNTKMGRQ